MARHAAKSRRTWLVPAIIAAVLVAGGASAALALSVQATPRPSAANHPPARTLARSDDPTTATTSTGSTATTTSTLPPAAPGFEAGHVTAVGDSVMLDYQQPLQTDIPGADVRAAVSEQWGAGESQLQELKSAGQLGAQVIVALSTNGPITDADFDSMMGILAGASRVVFVNVHVDRPWQDPNNAVLARGAARYPHVFIADWATLAGQNPEWFGADGTHLAINGPGAVALASLITSTLTSG